MRLAVQKPHSQRYQQRARSDRLAEVTCQAVKEITVRLNQPCDTLFWSVSGV